jgi:ferredoxin
MAVSAFTVTLVTPSGTQKIECDESTIILDAAEDSGLDLPYSCRSGGCTSCVGKIVSGNVSQDDMTEQMVYKFLDPTQAEEFFDANVPAAGKYVWTCIAYPTEDVTITTHLEEELQG